MPQQNEIDDVLERGSNVEDLVAPIFFLTKEKFPLAFLLVNGKNTLRFCVFVDCSSFNFNEDQLGRLSKRLIRIDYELASKVHN